MLVPPALMVSSNTTRASNPMPFSGKLDYTVRERGILVNTHTGVDNG